MKNVRYLLYLSPLLLFAACGGSDEAEIVDMPPHAEYYNQVAGEAQGTTYHISWIDTEQENLKPEFDSILAAFDLELSNWNEASLIREINAHDTSVYSASAPFLVEVMRQSKEVWSATDGAFDPSLYPLISAWGFGLKNREEMDETKVATLKAWCGFENYTLEFSATDQSEMTLKKPFTEAQLDFNAIAQGYSVDVVCEWLDARGIQSYLVEIGGELRVKGTNQFGDDWRVQVDKPVQSDESNRERQAVINMPANRALATSGSYRKFWEQDGIKYSHTIDPKTGFPVQHSLLSVTVIANTCAFADAYATAFMVMGTEGTQRWLREFNADHNMEVYLVYSDEEGVLQTWSSEGMTPIIEEATDTVAVN